MLADAAKTLLKQMGKEIILTKKTKPADYDPTNRTSVVVKKTHTFQGVVLSFNTDQIDGISVTKEDNKVIVTAKGAPVVPTTEDDIKFDSDDKERSIISVRTIEQAGVDIIYELQVR